MKLYPVTCGPKHHWFGYYDKSSWSADGRSMLAMEADFADRAPGAEDRIRLGLVDAAGGGNFDPFAETSAWCWQTGCMLQWFPGAARKAIYNVRDGDHFASVVHDLETGARRMLPLPIFCVTPDGRTALSLNFARLARYRPGYGYEGLPDPFAQEVTPERDGVWMMDVESGRHRLIMSLAQISAIEHSAEMEGVAHRFNHIQINTDGTRFAVLHRYMRKEGRGHITRLFTANLDGSDLYLLNPNRKTSHYDWRDNKSLLAWARVPGTTIEAPKVCYILFHDRSPKFEIVGDGLFPEGDGHCSYSPDRQLLITDSYPDELEKKRTLMLYHPATNRRMDIGRFLAPPPYEGDIRCDLHPRWSRDGRSVCFDSVHEGTRQMYVADVSDARHALTGRA
jgi:hypothetical protein